MYGTALKLNAKKLVGGPNTGLIPEKVGGSSGPSKRKGTECKTRVGNNVNILAGVKTH